MHIFRALTVAVLLGSGTAWAEPVKSSSEHVPEFSHQFDAVLRYGTGSRLEQGNRKFGDLESFAGRIDYTVARPVSDAVILRAGLSWDRQSFGLPAGVPLPNTLQSAMFRLGADVELSDQWLMRVEIQPGIYSDFQDLSSRDLNMPAILGFTYLVDADLQWFFGLGIDPRFGARISNFYDSPVFPGVGVRWRFAEDWTLFFVLPTPRIEYQINENLTAYLGAGVQGGTYRLADDFGTQVGRTDLNSEVVNYREVRVGPGLRWKLSETYSVEVEGGYIVERRFEFPDAQPKRLVIESEGAGYGSVGLSARF